MSLREAMVQAKQEVEQATKERDEVLATLPTFSKVESSVLHRRTVVGQPVRNR
jgi:hypothetical protein